MGSLIRHAPNLFGRWYQHHIRKEGRETRYWPTKLDENFRNVVFFISPRNKHLQKGLQIAHWLSKNSHVFQKSICKSSLAIKDLLGWTLEGILNESLVRTVELSEAQIEPVMAAIQIAYCDLLASHKVIPAAVLCTSGGEFASAYISGSLPAGSTIQLVCEWSKATSAEEGIGITVAIFLSADEAMDLAIQTPGPVFLACDFTPTCSLVSTTYENLNALFEILNKYQAQYKQMPFRAGYHSPLMTEWAARAEAIVARIGTGQPKVNLYSAVSGGRILKLDSSHWTGVIAGTALFQGAARAVLLDGYTTFLEINILPHYEQSLREIADSIHQAVNYITMPSDIEDA